MRALPALQSSNDGNSSDDLLNMNSSNNNNDEPSYLRRPLGNVLEEYTIGTTKAATSSVADNNGSTPRQQEQQQEQQHQQQFCLSLARGKQVASYHDQVQKLALFFIESADGVDCGGRSGGILERIVPVP